MRYIDAPKSVIRKQIKRDEKNNRTYAKRKREVAVQKAAIAVVAILWIFCIFMAMSAKAKPAEDTYVTAGRIISSTGNGYIVEVNSEERYYETDNFYAIGKMVSIEMNGNYTLEVDDDEILSIY